MQSIACPVTAQPRVIALKKVQGTPKGRHSANGLPTSERPQHSTKFGLGSASDLRTCWITDRRSKGRSTGVQGTGSRVTAAAPDSTEAPVSTRSMAFQELGSAAGMETSLELRAAGPPRYSGLYSPSKAKKGEIVMHIPSKLCLVMDYASGLRLPSDGSWPQLVEAVNREEPLPWDLLLALALLDASEGNGGEFWKDYSDAILPPAEELTLPFCLPDPLLDDLQHSPARDGAVTQRQRLAGLFPHLCTPEGSDPPAPILRFFACVRSRAFKASDDCFAFVPFLDAANHSNEPNADFRCTPQGDWQLVAVKDISAGDEVTISYTGQEGYTNRRLMAQYGFVPLGGNHADRVNLETDLGLPASQVAKISVAKLSGMRIQSVVGEDAFKTMMSGQNMYLYEAIKSIPMEDDEDNSPRAGEVPNRESAEAILRACNDTLAGMETSLEDDEGLLQSTSQDTRLQAVIVYRLERKKLLSCLRGVMERYLKA